jgi:2'-5' RNA ligase
MSKSGSTQGMGNGVHDRMQKRYDRLWASAVGKIRSGKVDLDPILASGTPDRRRGLTLIVRPSPDVRKKITAFLNRLRGLEPEQYYYAPSELHVTVLSLFTAVVDHRRFFAKTKQYMVAVESALEKTAPIQVEFNGVTASRGAIMIQGFVRDEMLDELREGLRRQLRVRGVAEGVDGRYRLETAHITVARFRAPLRDGGRLARELERARPRAFGSMDVRRVRLVRNDWYMTRGVMEKLAGYELGG